MPEVNPYEPPNAEYKAHALSVGDVIRAKIQITPEFMVESISRYRLSRQRRMARFAIRVFGAVLFGLCAAAGLYMWNVWIVAFCVLFTLLCLFPYKLDDWLIARRTRNSHRNGELVDIEMSESGFKAVSEFQDIKLAWGSFTHWFRHSDGAMIFQGPTCFHWIPEASLSTESDLHRLFSLLESKLDG